MAEPASQPVDQGLEPMVDEIRRRIEDNERFLKALLDDSPEDDDDPANDDEVEEFEEL